MTTHDHTPTQATTYDHTGTTTQAHERMGEGLTRVGCGMADWGQEVRT